MKRITINLHYMPLMQAQREMNRLLKTCRKDTDEIEVETYETATYFDDYYQCEVPYIYDNGILLEALAWYVLFKYLSRGSKHQVYSLASNSPVTNPYLQWNLLRPKAMAAVKIAIKNDNEGWNNFFYNSTFLPRG